MSRSAENAYDPLLGVALLTILLAVMLSTFRAASHFEAAQTKAAHVLYLSSDGSRVVAQR